MNKFAIGRFVRSAPARVGVAALAVLAATQAHAVGSGFDAAIDAVDLTGLAVKIAAAALLIIGVAIAFKSSTLGKRVVNKV